MTECTLCAVVDSGHVPTRNAYDTHLLITRSFVVIPALGPVTAGHVMVVSREHFANLASMPSEAIAAYNELVEGIAATDHYRRKHLLEAEHGSTEGERGGACITHVHVNLVPNAGRFVTLFDGALARLDVDHSLASLADDAAPYILLRNSTTVRLYRAKGAQSQLIRRALFGKLGREDWDWGAFPNHEVVAETLRLWGADAHDEPT